MDAKAGLGGGAGSAERSLLESLKEAAREVQRALNRHAADVAAEAAASKAAAGLPFARKAGGEGPIPCRPSSAAAGAKALATTRTVPHAVSPFSSHSPSSRGRPGTSAGMSTSGRGPTNPLTAAQLREEAELEQRLQRFVFSRDGAQLANARLGLTDLVHAKMADLMRRHLAASDKTVGQSGGHGKTVGQSGAGGANVATFLAAAERLGALHAAAKAEKAAAAAATSELEMVKAKCKSLAEESSTLRATLSSTAAASATAAAASLASADADRQGQQIAGGRGTSARRSAGASARTPGHPSAKIVAHRETAPKDSEDVAADVAAAEARAAAAEASLTEARRMISKAQASEAAQEKRAATLMKETSELRARLATLTAQATEAKAAAADAESKAAAAAGAIDAATRSATPSPRISSSSAGFVRHTAEAATQAASPGIDAADAAALPEAVARGDPALAAALEAAETAHQLEAEARKEAQAALAAAEEKLLRLSVAASRADRGDKKDAGTVPDEETLRGDLRAREEEVEALRARAEAAERVSEDLRMRAEAAERASEDLRMRAEAAERAEATAQSATEAAERALRAARAKADAAAAAEAVSARASERGKEGAGHRTSSDAAVCPKCVAAAPAPAGIEPTTPPCVGLVSPASPLARLVASKTPRPGSAPTAVFQREKENPEHPVGNPWPDVSEYTRLKDANAELRAAAERSAASLASARSALRATEDALAADRHALKTAEGALAAERALSQRAGAELRSARDAATALETRLQARIMDLTARHGDVEAAWRAREEALEEEASSMRRRLTDAEARAGLAEAASAAAEDEKNTRDRGTLEALREELERERDALRKERQTVNAMGMLTKTRTLKFEMAGERVDDVIFGGGGGGAGGARPGSARGSRPGSADQIGRLQRQVKELHARHNEVAHRLAAASEQLEESRDETHVLRESLARSEAMTKEQAMLIDLLQSRVELLERSLNAAQGITVDRTYNHGQVRSPVKDHTGRADVRINAVRQDVEHARVLAKKASTSPGGFDPGATGTTHAGSLRKCTGASRSTYLLKDRGSAAAALAAARAGAAAAAEVSREVRARAS